jgi:Fe-S-cluster containining protein
MKISELKDLVDNLENLKIGLDNTFQFSCSRCGRCCYWRDDIMVSPSDVFRGSKVLGIYPLDFISKYCEIFLGGQSRTPLLRIKSDMRDGHCVLLKNNQCIIHKGKPTVCALYPIGRFIENNHSGDVLQVGYINPGSHCGHDETHSVREWIASFGLEEEEEIFKQWSVYQFRFGPMFTDLENMLSHEEFYDFIVVFVGLVYALYDTTKEFLPQLINNCEMASGMVLSKIVRNRGPFYGGK